MGPEVTTGLLLASSISRSLARGLDTGPPCLALEEQPAGAPESRGLLGMGPPKPEGDFLMVGLAPVTFTKGWGFFSRCLPTGEPGRVMVSALSVLLGSLGAAEQNTEMLGETGQQSTLGRSLTVLPRHCYGALPEASKNLKIQKSIASQGCQQYL